MVVGDPTAWTDRFRSLDIRLLQCIVSIWPDCLGVLPPEPHEDIFTINLVDILSKNREARRLFHWLEFQYEPFGYSSNGAAYSKGKIDMALFLDQERERYLAYECKRLNVLNSGVRISLAAPYVKEGVKRFVTEQYAENLPVGCMLGYVMDGDTLFAQSKVHAAILANKSEIKLIAGPDGADAVSFIERFSTWHERKNVSSKIEIRHALLPFLLG